MFGITAWRQRRLLRNPGFSADQWREVVAKTALVRDWPEESLNSLRELTVFFLHSKVFSAANGSAITTEQRLQVALLACVPIFKLGIEYYTGWAEIIIYPDAFVTRHEEMDEAGVVHSWRSPLSGEAWSRGPVVLSQADVEESAHLLDGFNVVIHEMAHKLDILNGGDANGFPPLHRGMRTQDWARDWSAAYETFCIKIDDGDETTLDPYAAENPAEFFAVLSEAFFELPTVLLCEFPQVYAQLTAFYRLDPLHIK